MAKAFPEGINADDYRGRLETESGRWTIEEQAGHDFWLTRNRHGAGFWNGDWFNVSGSLTQLAQTFGEADLYVGDDGRIYQG